MIKPILNYNNKEDKKILSTPSCEVVDIKSVEVQKTIQDLKDTLNVVKGGKGLSAIQIGVPIKICICSWANKTIIMINPKILRTRGKAKYLEGCLSVPGKLKTIERAQKVWCTFINENGSPEEIAEGGRMSNIIQHELDHMEGICKIIDD